MSDGTKTMGSAGASKSLAAEIDRMKFDKRLTDLHVSRKKLTPDELKKHLDALPDLADNVARMDLDDSLN